MALHGLHLDIQTRSVSIRTVSTLGTDFSQRDYLRIGTECSNFFHCTLCI